MKNLYEPSSAKIIKIRTEAAGVKSFTLRFTDPQRQRDFYFFPGQFLMLSVAGWGEAPLAIPSASLKTDTFEVCVRKVGPLTAALHRLQVDEIVGIRGPLGQGYFPTKDLASRNLLLVAGGMGIVPLRTLVLDSFIKPQNFQKIQLFYGAKFETDLIYKNEFSRWREKVDLQLTVDEHTREKCPIVCDEGLITKLFETKKVVKNPLAFVVGPPVMCKFVITALQAAGVADRDIYLSLERHMDCGVGQCHHCGIGNKLVCKDGPVFSYEEIKNIPAAI
jgi:sulfhydrogenase subunit gamma (sulfur reductase)